VGPVSFLNFGKGGGMTIRSCAGALLFLIPFWCGAGELNMITPRKSIAILDGDRYAVVVGTWRRLSERSSIEIPALNSVHIECEKARRICDEYVAKVLQPSDHPDSGAHETLLFGHRTVFQILTWSRTLITARAEPRAADIDLRISLADQSAERTSRETGARGALGANPSHVTQWILE
jgi:hypothetical protein